MNTLIAKKMKHRGTGVNFTNILRAAFAPIFLRQKCTNPESQYKKKRRAKLSYEKAARKILVNLSVNAFVWPPYKPVWKRVCVLSSDLLAGLKFFAFFRQMWPPALQNVAPTHIWVLDFSLVELRCQSSLIKTYNLAFLIDCLLLI